MFEVQHEDDAWDLGVLVKAGLLWDVAPSDLGVPERLVEFFVAGKHDHAALSEERVGQLACRWHVSVE